MTCTGQCMTHSPSWIKQCYHQLVPICEREQLLPNGIVNDLRFVLPYALLDNLQIFFFGCGKVFEGRYQSALLRRLYKIPIQGIDALIAELKEGFSFKVADA